jgi:hypothetical protein
MKLSKLYFSLLLASGIVSPLGAQNDAMPGMVHKKSESYIYQKEPEVLLQ